MYQSTYQRVRFVQRIRSTKAAEQVFACIMEGGGQNQRSEMRWPGGEHLPGQVEEVEILFVFGQRREWPLISYVFLKKKSDA